ncbi:hypothetical protein NCS56_01110800 [Fusarium sp. Ph1]|nr:hypothetical protein NCS56_01110800 [Fusarium sp. Ph1]
MTDAMVQAHAPEQRQQGQKRSRFTHAHPGIVQTDTYKALSWYIHGVPKALSQTFWCVARNVCQGPAQRGTGVCADADKADKFWSYINQKGDVVLNKSVWGEEQTQMVSDHTRKISYNAPDASN